VDFLSEDQERAYGRYAEDLTDVQLAQFFYLDSADWTLLANRRGDHNRLGFALQVCTVRFLGTLLEDMRAIPDKVVAYVARQLDITDASACLERYQTLEARWDHAAEIRTACGYREFGDPSAVLPLARLLYTRAWARAERPSTLFEVAVHWLLERKVLLPGITVLARFVAHVRDRVARRLWQSMARVLTPDQHARLEALLDVPVDARVTTLDRLRQAPTRASAPALVQALERLEDVRALGVGGIDLAGIPANRLKVLATYAITSKVSTLAELAADRRAATLLAFARTLETTACDDALDVLDLLIRDLLSDAQRANKHERLRTLCDLDGAALALADRTALLLGHPDWGEADVRAYLERHRAQLSEAIATITRLARPVDDQYQRELRAKFPTVRRFLPRLLRTIDFAAAHAGQALLEALEFLKRIEAQRRPSMAEAPLGAIPAGWRRHVAPAGQPVDRRMYTLCVLIQLQEGLRKRDVFVPDSGRWSDPRAKLLQGAEWEAARLATCQVLGRAPTPESDLATWTRELHAAYQQTVARLPANTPIQVERVTDPATGKARDRLKITGLEDVPDPPSLQRLRARVNRRIPSVDLPSLLLEIEARTGFAAEFTHISEGRSRLDEFPISLCAVLMAQACNVPLSALAQPGIPALERDRLIHLQQNYLRPETIGRANARLVTFHRRIPLSAVWGGGEVASADGLRFVVPVRTINAGPNGKYFGTGRGITLINYTLNNFFGFNGAVVTGTLRDSLYVLEGLLQQDAHLRPHEIMTDTASYSDMVFGLFALLGYRFSPRLADLGDTRFWRMDPAADYGPLQGIARHRIDQKLIAQNWDDVLRVAGSLTVGAVQASEVMRMLQGGGRPTTVGRAIGEIGRIAKSFYLLDYLDDEAYRRRILIQLNRGEGRHGLARVVFFGRKGEVRERYREGQEEQLGALGLVVNLIVVWNTLYLDRALADLRKRGMDIAREDVERLSPLGHQHLNLLGRYSFALSDAIRRGDYLPLREWEEEAGGLDDARADLLHP
jgi:TnpA family transposase